MTRLTIPTRMIMLRNTRSLKQHLWYSFVVCCKDLGPSDSRTLTLNQRAILTLIFKIGILLRLLPFKVVTQCLRKYAVKYLFNAIHWNNESKFIAHILISNSFDIDFSELISSLLLYQNKHQISVKIWF